MGEGGEIFILDMGEPVRIVDLARDMITLNGLEPDEDIAIEFTGIRPGEKLFEELQTDAESIAKTRHPKIFIGKLNSYPLGKLDGALDHLRELSSKGEDAEIRSFLNAILPEAQLDTPASI